MVELSYQVYKSHDSGISSNGFANLSPNKREEGDGEEYSQNGQNYSQNATLRIQDKYSLEPPEVPPRDYTTDEDGPQIDNGELHTVRKFSHFSVTLILREIIFAHFRGSKTAILIILEPWRL